jgi:CRISPR-associated endonuclease/helicase Cas3
MIETPEEFFAHYFALLTGGRPPFPWQAKLFRDMIENQWPDSLPLPTGSGKTAILYVWLIALAWSLRQGRRSSIPRRLVWVVNRRVVVDQATDEAERIQKTLDHLPSDDPLVGALANSSVSRRPLSVSTLRGQRADNRDWSRDPSAPAILVGTVDMVGSRLLFRGYRDSRYWRPYHAGLLGVDSLIVNDESHLTPAFAELLIAVRDMHPAARLNKPFRILLVSATERGLGARPFAHELHEDVAGSESFRRVYEAEKRLYIHDVPDNKAATAITRELALRKAVPRTIVFVEEPEKAADLAAQFEKEVGTGRVALLTGTMRGRERDALASDPVFAAFTQSQAPEAPLYLVTTSAAEVGVNITGERLVTRLVESDRLMQRLGRLNRFGDHPGAPHRIGEAHLVCVPLKRTDDDESPESRTLEFLRSLPETGDGGYDVSCRALHAQPPPRASASVPAATARLESRLVDLWSQTSATGPAIPRVASWLHGEQDDLPDAELAWREEVTWIANDSDAARAYYEDVLSSYRVLPEERLKEPVLRVCDKLKRIAEVQPDVKILFQARDGQVESMTVKKAAESKPEDLAYGLLLLPPACGGLWRGMFRAVPEGDDQYDIADTTTLRRRYLLEFDGAQWKRRRVGIGTGEAGEEIPEKEVSRASLVQFAKSQQLGAPLKIALAPEFDGRERYLIFFPSRAEKRATDLEEVDLDAHCQAVAGCAATLAGKLGIDELTEVLRTAGNLHDRGKANELWQRAMGGDPGHPKAKTVGGAPARLAGFRHELASVVAQPDDTDDLILYLVGTHHGWGRPHWEPRAYDRKNLAISQETSLRAARRFGCLQRMWGPWGLAWIETLLRAADIMVSSGDVRE